MRLLAAAAGGIALFAAGAAVGHVATAVAYGVLVDSAQASGFQALQEEAYARYRCGTPEHAERSLRRQAELAQALASHADDRGQEENFRKASALAYGRMAVLRERAGRPDEAAELFRKAMAALQTTDAAIPANIREAVLVFDASWERDFAAPQR